jgi:hypothetical protein
MTDTDTEFTYTYIPADGSLPDLKKRFRIVDHGPQILKYDRSTATTTPHDGDLLLIPTPKDIPWFDKADWQSVEAKPGETLPALIKRAQSDWTLPSKGRVMRDFADVTLGYVWHDWRNASVRQGLLAAADIGAEGSKADMDPHKVQFKGTEQIVLPLKPVKHFEAPVAPGKPGDNAGPVATVDVSHSEFEELHDLLDSIGATLDWLDRTREQALGVQAKCETWLIALSDLREQAIKSDAAWTMIHPNDDPTGKRQSFIGALGALIDKVSPLILDLRSCVPKVAPQLVTSSMEKVNKELLPLIQNARTKELLAKLIPSHGDLPRLERGGDGTIITIDKVCVLAARAAHWVAEAAPRDTATSLLTVAMTAMASGTAPTASVSSIIDFAVAIPFFAPPPKPEVPPDDASLADFRDLFDTATPEGCATVVAQVFWALKIAEAAANLDGTIASAATDRVGDGLDKIASRSGWTSFKADFQLLAKDGFKSWSEFKDQYNPIEEAKGVQDTGQAIAQAADPTIQAAKMVRNEPGTAASARLGIQAAKMYGADEMRRAYAIVEEMQSPSQRFPAQWRTPGKKLPALWGLGKLAFQVEAGVKGTGSDWDGSVAGALKTERAALETVKDAAEALQKLKIIETEELTLMLGRVTLVLGVAIELCEIREAVEEGNIVGALSHGALAAACICFLIGGVCCTVGTGLLIVGTLPLIVRGKGLNSETALQFSQIFPDENDGAARATFESLCSKPLELDGQIKQVKKTFGDAVAETRAISRPPSPW